MFDFALDDRYLAFGDTLAPDGLTSQGSAALDPDPVPPL